MATVHEDGDHDHVDGMKHKIALQPPVAHALVVVDTAALNQSGKKKNVLNMYVRGGDMEDAESDVSPPSSFSSDGGFTSVKAAR